MYVSVLQRRWRDRKTTCGHIIVSRGERDTLQKTVV